MPKERKESGSRANPTTSHAGAPERHENLRAEIIDRYQVLSPRLQEIARFTLDHPNDMAIETVATIAKRIETQPSAIIRFAKAFGFAGFSDMQRLFQSALLEGMPNYNERMRRALDISGETPVDGVSQILREFSAANTASLQHLQNTLPADQLERATDMLSRARIIHLFAVRRSFPIAAYMAYGLSHADCQAHLLNGVAGLHAEQLQLVSESDVLIAISANPYAQETVTAIETVARRKVPVIAITDSPVSPIARSASIAFIVHEAELRGFRSLTATFCLAQAMIVGLALSRTAHRKPLKEGSPTTRKDGRITR
jgi:DNA-binding MurR/RpiR family transcriptional regulator